MAVTLMTTTGTQEHVNEALGLPADTGAAPAASLMAPQVTAQAEALPAKGAVEAPPAPVQAAPEAMVAPMEGVGAPEDDPDAMPEGLTPQQQGAHTRSRMQKRIDGLVKARYTTEGHLEAANAELMRLRQQLGVQATPDPASVASAAPSPTPSPVPASVTLTRPQPQNEDSKPDGTPKYETFDEYILDLTKWQFEQLEAAKEAKTRQIEVQRALTEEQTAVQKHIDAFKVEHPDFDAVINQPDLKVNGGMLRVLRNPRNAQGPAMAYYLAQHPDECKRIFDLPYDDAIEEMGVIKATLGNGNGKPVARPVAQPKAPPPPTTVRSGAAVSATTLEEDAKTITPGSHRTSEWIARRNAELAQRGRR